MSRDKEFSNQELVESRNQLNTLSNQMMMIFNDREAIISKQDTKIEALIAEKIELEQKLAEKSKQITSLSRIHSLRDVLNKYFPSGN